jgi:hypothetical protein
MTMLEWGALGELIGGIAIIVSLIYVGIQVNDNAGAVRSAAANDANGAMQSWYLEIGSNQQASELWYGAMTSEAVRSNQEEFQFLMMTHAAFLGFQNSYLLAEEGTIDPELREALNAAILGVKDLPGMSRYWRQRRSYLHKDFVEYVNELLTGAALDTVDIYRMPEVKPER